MRLFSDEYELDGIAGFIGRAHVHSRERDQPAVNRVIVTSDHRNARRADEREAIALNVSVLEMSQMKLGASHLIARDVIDLEPEAPELIAPRA